MALMLAQATEAAPPSTEAPPAPATSSGTEQAHEHYPFPPFDGTWFASQLLWLAITFIALYLLLARVAIPRIGGILRNRADRIARDIESAEKAKADSEAAMAVYEAALASARSNAGAIADGARNEAKAQAATERGVIEADLAKKLAEAEQRIAGIKSRALSEVNAIASDTASAIVKALIDADVGKAEADNAVAAAVRK
jgi:F-type H+-transporting ATPase subunit b